MEVPGLLGPSRPRTLVDGSVPQVRIAHLLTAFSAVAAFNWAASIPEKRAIAKTGIEANKSDDFKPCIYGTDATKPINERQAMELLDMAETSLGSPKNPPKWEPIETERFNETHDKKWLLR